MKNILDFCYQKINYIVDKLDMFILKSGADIEFVIPYSNSEKLKFKYVGSGTYGNVLRVKNMTNEESIVPRGKYFIMKIMKSKHDEPERCIQINRVKKRIKNQKKKKVDTKIKLELIEKYTTSILDVKKGKRNDVVFLEFIPGYDLKDLVVVEVLNQLDIDLIFLMTLVSVRIFHKILRMSHRDLKLENLFFNQETKKVQILDYSFVCDKEDYDCYRRNQGTAKYIHPKQNKRTMLKYNRKRNNSVISMVNSPRTQKKIYNYPQSFSQDLYSCFIILLKLHYQHTKRNLSLLNDSNRWVYDIVEDYNNSFKKSKNKYEEKKARYQVKKKLFKKLLGLEEEQIFSPSIQVIIFILRKYWNNKKRDFVIDGKTGDKIAAQILDELIEKMIQVTKLTKSSSKESESLLGSKSIKKEILDDVFKLQKITVVGRKSVSS